MGPKFRPSEVSRDDVQVVLRMSTSTSPDCSAVKRSFADSGTNLTLLTSLKMAAAIARHTSTSSPVHLPCASGKPKPASVPLAPQLSVPRFLTVASVWADAADAVKPRAAATAKIVAIRFMKQPLLTVCVVMTRHRPFLSLGFGDSPPPGERHGMERQQPGLAGYSVFPALSLSLRISERSHNKVKGLRSAA